MKIKKDVILSLLVLFFLYILFCLVRPPTIADSLVVLVIGSLVGFFRFIQFKTPPVVSEKEIPQDLQDKKNQIEKLMLDKDLAMLYYDIYKLHASAHTVKAKEADAKKPFIF